MKEYFKKIEVLALVFIFFIIIFTAIYSSELKFTDAFYTSVSFQTFTGTNVVENKDKLKVIASIQMILSYLLVAIVLYSIL